MFIENDMFIEKICLMYYIIEKSILIIFRIFEKDDGEESVIEFHNLNDLLTMDEEHSSIDTEDVITLPAHHKCVSHLLNLIAVKDSERALEDDLLYKKKYRAIFAKLTKLWNKQNQSTQVADKIKEICGVYLKTPVITRHEKFSLSFYISL